MKALADECSKRVAREVDRFDGKVLKVVGDAVMVVFGAPVGHEDDPERAVRAALAMREAVSELQIAGEPLALHIGINTGEVMAGMVGPEELHEYSVMGDVTNTAARLMSAAPRDCVFVGNETYLATRHAVLYREIEPIAAKGKSKPVTAWEVIDVAPVPKARSLGKTTLVGRDEELSVLARIWEEVIRERRPHLVTVVGEPGVGKSRLAAEFERRELGSAVILHGRCLPYGELLGYWALAAVVKEAAGIGPDDSREVARARLNRLVGMLRFETDANVIGARVALLAGLDVDADQDYEADQRTLHAAARHFLEALARRQALCVMLDDLHWADDAMVDLVEFIASQAKDAPLLLCVQARPDLLERRPSWEGGPHTLVRLQPLDEEGALELLGALFAEHNLAGDQAQQISRHVQGNPLFAEEWVAMMSERGITDEIPSSVRTLIAARLDAFPAEQRRAVQVAGVFGNVFWDDALPYLEKSADLTSALMSLNEKDVIRSLEPTRFPGFREFEFKHGLIRDVAYEMLPRAERRVLHERAAEWIEKAAGNRSEQNLDLLVYHTVEAGQDERAVSYLSQAAVRARRAAAHQEEAALLEEALAIAKRIGRSELEAALHAARGRAFGAIGAWAQGKPEMEAALAGLPTDDHEAQAQALTDLANYSHWLFEVPKTREHATAALALAEEIGRDDLAAGAIAALALAESSDGNLKEALEKHRRAFALAGVNSAFLAPARELDSLILYWLGRFEEAVIQARAAVEMARAAGDTTITMRALSDLGLALTGAGRYDDAIANFEEARSFGSEHGVYTWLGRCIAMQGGLYLDLFDFVRAEELAREARELGRSSNFPLPVVSGGIDLLLNFARCQEPGKAERLTDEVGEAVEKASGAHGWLWRLRFAEARAEMALARNDADDAVRWANETIRLGRARGRVKYEVEGLESHARALMRRGQTKEAVVDLRKAIDLARPTGNPVMLLRPASVLLSLDGDDALAVEARASVKRIIGALPDLAMRERFASAEPVGLVTREG